MKKLLVGALILAFPSLASAYTFYNSNHTGALDINARMFFLYQKATDGYDTYNYQGLKANYLAITPYANFNKVQIGASYRNRWRVYVPSKYFLNKTAASFVFIQSPKLGKTQIGKTSGIYEDFMLRVQGFNNSLTGYIPFFVEPSHNLVFKYNSSFTKPYNYGFSITNYRKTLYGNLRQLSFRYAYQKHITDDSRFELEAMFSNQNYKYAELREYKVKPFAISLSFIDDNNLTLGLAYYHGKEEITEYNKGNLNYHLNHYGYYFKGEIPFTDRGTIYLHLGYHYVQNPNSFLAYSTDGSVFTANSKRIIQNAKVGSIFKFTRYLTVHAEFDLQKNTYLPDGRRVNLLTQIGAEVKF